MIFFNLGLELKKGIVHEKELDNLDLKSVIARLQDIENKQGPLTASIGKSHFREILNSLASNLGNQN